MTVYNYFIWWFGSLILWGGTIILIHDYVILRPNRNRIRMFLIDKKSQYFGTWCAVLKYKNRDPRSESVDVVYLTKFFACIGLWRANSYIRYTYPNNKIPIYHAFMYKKEVNHK